MYHVISFTLPVNIIPNTCSHVFYTSFNSFNNSLAVDRNLLYKFKLYNRQLYKRNYQNVYLQEFYCIF